MYHTAVLTFCLILLYFPVIAQKPVQQIRGVVIDGITQQPVEGAEVYLEGTAPLKGAVSDSEGNFKLDQVSVGRYVLVVKHVAFHTYTNDVMVEGGKPIIIKIALFPSFKELQHVVITEAPFIADLQTWGKRTVSIEQATRFAANYLDPARVMISFPGVVLQNDQSNNLVINGKSPNGLLWRVEGMDVLNPNHLSNAGTLTDRPTQHGGGVNILSTQMLGNTNFVTAPFGPQYGNALSGVMEMNLRSGNDQSNNYTAQASLIGLDLAAEGPIKMNRSSFLINYRYSTVGLLSKLGVDFGGEEINFQDLSFNLTFDQKKGRRLTVFGYGGNSENIFEGVKDVEEWSSDKDSTMVQYSSRSAAVGFNEIIPLGAKSSLKVGSVFSALGNDRSSNSINRNMNKLPSENYELKRWMVSSRAEYNTKLSSSSQLTTGAMINFSGEDILAQEFHTARGTLINKNGTGTLIQPYAGIKARLTAHLSADAGIRHMYYSFNKTSATLPSLKLNYSRDGRNYWDLGYSLQAQVQSPQVYLSSGNSILEMSKMHHLGMGYSHHFDGALLTSHVFYERLYDIPVSESGSYSILNHVNEYVLEPLENEGTGKIYGINVSYERPVREGLYYILGGSLFESKYRGADGVQRNSRFNNNFTLSVTGGKEFVKEKADGIRILGINGRVYYAGGLRTSPVSAGLSEQLHRTAFIDELAFSEKLGDYFRVDFQINFRKEKTAYTRVVAIDIQNLFSIANDGYRYYDFRKGGIVDKKQLGIIPVLIYRVEF